MMKSYSAELNIKEGLNKVRIKKGLFKYIHGFELLSLKEGKQINLESKDYELGLVILKGSCDITIDGRIYKDVGFRDDVFNGRPAGIYIPINKEYTIISHNVEIAICKSTCDRDSDFAIIYPKDIKITQVGKDNWKREVRIIIGQTSPSVNLIVGETINPPGNWSGTPPHKHENYNPPFESLHEELYYFRVDRPCGFGIERLYSYERNIYELIPIYGNIVTFMPFGYHQIVSGPGYRLYYLFFLSGKGKEIIGFVDPNDKWINE